MKPCIAPFVPKLEIVDDLIAFEHVHGPLLASRLRRRRRAQLAG
jgi:hypothetical protein